MLTANFLGLGVGIMLSFVTGPVFFSLIKTSLEKGFLSGAALATGVLFGDSLWVIITFYGTKFIALEQKYAMLTAVIGGVFLIALGVYYLAKKVEIKYESVEDKLHLGLAGYGIKGFLITFFNPSVLVFWLTVNSLLKAVFHIQSSFDSYENLVFFYRNAAHLLYARSVKGLVFQQTTHPYQRPHGYAYEPYRRYRDHYLWREAASYRVLKIFPKAYSFLLNLSLKLKPFNGN